jgi:hypothetical protein
VIDGICRPACSVPAPPALLTTTLEGPNDGFHDLLVLFADAPLRSPV